MTSLFSGVFVDVVDIKLPNINLILETLPTSLFIHVSTFKLINIVLLWLGGTVSTVCCVLFFYGCYRIFGTV